MFDHRLLRSQVLHHVCEDLDGDEKLIVLSLAYPSSNPYPQQQQQPQQQSGMYPQLHGNAVQQQPYRAPYGATSSPNSQQPNYHTTVVVQPSPTYGGGGGYGGYRGGGGSSLAGVGMGLAGGALLGGKISRKYLLSTSLNFSHS